MRLDDWLHGETGDSCALCGVRGVRVLTKHHIDRNSQNEIYENLIILCHNCHTSFHQSKGVTASDILNRKRHLIQKTLTTYGVNALKIAARNNVGVIAMPFLLYHLVDLGFMTKEENQMGYGEQVDATARFAVTDRGRELVSNWLR